MPLKPEQIFVFINEYYTHLLERTAIRIMVVDVLPLMIDFLTPQKMKPIL